MRYDMPLSHEASAALTAVLLRRCRATASLAGARRLHALLLTSGQPPSTFTFNHVLSMYANCGSLFNAHKVFDEIPQRNIVSYNSLISAYARHSTAAINAFNLLAQMRRETLRPNAGSFTGLLQAASKLKDLFAGLALHSQVLRSGSMADAYVFTSLLGFYSNCGDLDSAVDLFDFAVVDDAVTWNCIISGCLKNDRAKDGLSLFRRMIAANVIPTEFTYSVVLKACGKLGCYGVGRIIHGRITAGDTLVDLPLENALIDMYSSCGDIKSAFSVFSRISCPDLVSRNSMILACSEINDGEGAMTLFSQMIGANDVKPDEYSFAAVLSAIKDLPHSLYGEPIHALALKFRCESSVFVGSTLVSMYCSNGRTESAELIFSSIAKKDVILWTELIHGYSSSGDSENSLKLFKKMINEGIEPDCFVLSTALNVCADLASLIQGQMLHSHCIKLGCDSYMSVCGGLIDMYAKNGGLEAAQSIFDGIADPDLMCWNAMIGSFGHHGKADEALKLVDGIFRNGLVPDEVTFISLISVCAHNGLVETGRNFWSLMLRNEIVPGPKHYSSMVSLLSRAGLFEEAKEIIPEEESGSHVELWRTVLSSAVARKNLEVGVYAAEKVLECDGEDSATHILLSNLYAAVGKWDGVVETRKRMRSLRMEKDPGLSWTQLTRDPVVFSSGDDQIDGIRVEVQRLQANLGFRPNVEDI